jgi:hypothetical protein
VQLHEGEQAALVEEGLSEGIVHMAGSGIPPGAMSVIGGLPHARSSSSPLCMSRAARVRPFSSTACQPFAGRCRRLLWPLLASAAPSRRLTAPLAQSGMPEAGRQTSQVKRATFVPSTRRIYDSTLRMTLGFRFSCPLARVPAPLCDSCSSGQNFACSFLQTPSRDDALAVRLTVPVIRVRRGLPPPSRISQTPP